MNGPHSPGGSGGQPPGYPPGQAPPGHPPHGQPAQGYPSQGYPSQGHPPGAPSPQGHRQQGYPPQGHHPPQGYPPHGQHQGHGAYGQQPPPPHALAHPTSGLCIEANYIFLQWILAFTHPVVTIYGRPMPITWGRPHAIPLPPGNHPVRVHFPYILTDGNPVEMIVPVHPGHATHLKYSTSFFVFSSGNLHPQGFRPWGM